MPYEIDMLNVGNADAIILRYFNDQNKEYIVLIDAGKTEAHGKKVVEHIEKHTTKKSIDLAISTHPDKDHIYGFFYVIKYLHIEEFWIHDPRAHQVEHKEIIPFSTNINLEKGLQYVMESLFFSKDLITIIDEKNILREEPLDGLTHSDIPITVLGPSREYYQEKLLGFRDYYLFESTELMKSYPVDYDAEGWEKKKKDFDKQRDRSSENNSSTILLFYGDGKKVLFTSDTGPEAIEHVVNKYDLKNLDFLDVPHHGSKNNLTTAIMDELSPKTAFISCEGNYPDQFIVDYLSFRGARVFSTKIHGGISHRYQTPSRDGWHPIKPM